MRSLRSLLAVFSLCFAATAAAAPNFSVCPNVEANDAGCALLITVNANGTTSFDLNPKNSLPYDGVEDSLIGIINNSAAALAQITLSSPNQPIFGFDGDGLCFYQPLAYCSKAATGYEGPNNAFANINTINFRSGDVVFLVPLAANGGSAYFSLEESPAAIADGLSVGAVPEPETYALMALGLGLLGWQARSRRVKRIAE